MAWHGSSRRGADRPVVIGYQGAAAALLLTLAAVGLAEARVAHNASSTEPVLTVALCAVLVGIAYYLGAPGLVLGMGQRLSLVTRFVSVMPIAGLIFLPGTNGLYRLTRRRLYVRNIAIFAGMLVFEMATQEFGNPAAAGAVRGIPPDPARGLRRRADDRRGVTPYQGRARETRSVGCGHAGGCRIPPGRSARWPR